MKYPEEFYQMSLDEQETWLAMKIININQLMEKIRKDLAKVRGGTTIKK